jgi:hypothetical protein
MVAACGHIFFRHWEFSSGSICGMVTAKDLISRMKTVQLLAKGIALYALALAPVFAQGTNTNTTNHITGQWNFDQGDLSATIGSPIQLLPGTEDITTFESVQIGDENAKVFHFGPADGSQGYLVYHGAKPNGGGTNVNEYTLLMDIMWPAESDGTFRALFNTDTNNQSDAVMFVNPDGAIGIQNQYVGQMLADTWYRLGFVFNLTNGTVTKYLNGTNIDVQDLGDNTIDSQFSLGPALLLFTDNDNETAAGYVNSIEILDIPLTDDQMAALGGPTAAGFGGTAAPAGDVKIESIQYANQQVTITVSGGGNIQLQRKTSLNDAAWTNEGSPSASGSFTVPASGAAGFFRASR